MEETKLSQVSIRGYKSIHADGQTIRFGDITLLLGANGSGKSNLVSFFKMLNFITSEGLQVFIGKQGGADAILHYGAKQTDKLVFEVTFEQGKGNTAKRTVYRVKLVHGMPDRLFFAGEQVEFTAAGHLRPQQYFLPAGGGESALPNDKQNHTTSRVLFGDMVGIRAYQFHDTSDTARIKLNAYIDDVRYLRSDAGNLAAFLRGLQQNEAQKRYYDRIKRHIAKVMPQFGDFDLEPLSDNDKTVRLNWLEVGRDYLFGPHQISDGSLRFMALAALLLQPPEMLPKVIVLDEPELGLHPSAIAELAGMIRVASQHAQVIVATQSTRLVDEFSIDDLVVVERDELNRRSEFKRLDSEALAHWLSRYSLSELWEKNVLGGRP